MPSNFGSSSSTTSKVIFLIAFYIHICLAWLPDTSTKLINNANKIKSISFKGNGKFPDHFIVLYQDDLSLLIGGRNRIYNLSTIDLSEKKDFELHWESSEYHSQFCQLKGKTDNECQNYLRLLFYTSHGKFLVCGTNSYKPMCRHYHQKDETYIMEEESDGIGRCPFDPNNNSTAIYSDGHLYSATGDFSGGDSFIYRKPLQTELSDLKQLNAPNFVSSMNYGDYIYFFFRETAVEFMNCGKVIYSRVARVCKHDKGGPHKFRDRWTTFAKARLNCSVPGEYPFYFDEIQSTSTIVKGKYGSNSSNIMYSVQTTPDNAIGASALCIFKMTDIEDVFKGQFKYQESINSNWLPVPDDKVPKPRPGECVKDSRILPITNVNFMKTHPLMEKAVPALFGQPILIRVSLHYRFTAVVVDAQVRTLNDRTYDVIYIGTDDGKVLKVVNIPSEQGDTAKAVVISENEVFNKGVPVKQLKTVPGYGKVVAVSVGEAKLVSLNHCGSVYRCSDCLELRDPHCAWDTMKSVCITVDTAISFTYLLQDVQKANVSRCRLQYDGTVAPYEAEINNNVSNDIVEIDEPNNEIDLKENSAQESSKCESPDGYPPVGCSQQKKLECTSVTFYIIIVFVAIGSLFVGFLSGFFLSRKYHIQSQYPSSPFVEQHNHLERLNANQTSFLARPTKTVNLDVLNVSNDSLPPKKDNLGSLKNLNITNEGTLQKIKKTYI